MAAHRLRSRRRWAAAAGAGGAAVVTLAVVTGIAGAVPRASIPQPPAAATPSTSPPPVTARDFTQPEGLGFTIAQTRVGVWQIGPAGRATLGYQQIPVYRDGKTLTVDNVAYPYPDGLLTLYRPGVFDIATSSTFPSQWPKQYRTTYSQRTDVVIAGRPGIEQQFTYQLPILEDLRAKKKANPGPPRLDDPSIKTETFTRTAFAWKFDGTSWATFVPGPNREPLSRTESLAIVEAVAPGKPEPARVPYTFGWLPAGWSVSAAELSPTDIISGVLLNPVKLSGTTLDRQFDEYPAAGRLTIWQGRPKPNNAPAEGQTMKCQDINGYCTLLIDRDHFAQFERVGKTLSMDDVRHILRELRFTTVADRDSWKPVPTA
ncbi:hypothetical protein ABZ403_07585 [Micromonospora zamorensis]|uniref:hypothetical protein n=1 Tax=Micromonospora zamorensis TaxID=709883 RepID=UPI00340D641C